MRLSLASIALTLVVVQAAAAADDPPLPPPLASREIPEPPDLDRYVRDRSATIALGKALFWDMQLGSDGQTACATCHFRAGADPRSLGQVSPGLLRVDRDGVALPDRGFDLGPIRALLPSDFPLRRLADPDDRAAAPLSATNDVVGSQGIAFRRYVRDRSGRERSVSAPDPDGFAMPDGTNLRRVTLRNAPSVVNAVFNHRNFWDGHAQSTFNGVDEWGDRNPDARVFRAAADGALEPVSLRVERASLASQALAPLVSSTESSADGRTVADVGRRVTVLRPLARQFVAADDSALGALASSGTGVAIDSYARWIKQAFHPEWWRSPQLVQRTPDGAVRVVTGADGDDTTAEYRLVEWNFGLFFGLAVQLYEATLVSDDTPFDRWRAGDETAVSGAARRGADLFRSQTRGRCINCHTGPEFTDASFAAVTASPVRIREGQALERGYNNIGVRDTLEDLGVGGVDPSGRWLAEVRRRDPAPAEPIAVDGAFKAPGLRNVELTAPYFHDGGTRTLDEVLDFYSRGGDLESVLARDGMRIAPLHVLALGTGEKADLVAFLRSLTDERVRHRRAPFDHPQILVPDGVAIDARGRIRESWIEVPAVGRGGGFPLPGFLE